MPKAKKDLTVELELNDESKTEEVKVEEVKTCLPQLETEEANLEAAEMSETFKRVLIAGDAFIIKTKITVEAVKTLHHYRREDALRVIETKQNVENVLFTFYLSESKKAVLNRSGIVLGTVDDKTQSYLEGTFQFPDTNMTLEAKSDYLLLNVAPVLHYIQIIEEQVGAEMEKLDNQMFDFRDFVKVVA